jgi:hypothetical protein
MITIIGLDGTYYAVRNEAVAAGLLAALPHLIPVEFNPAHTEVKEPPKVQGRCIDLDVVLVHHITVRKTQHVENEVGRLAKALESEWGVSLPIGGSTAVVDATLQLLRDRKADG